MDAKSWVRRALERLGWASEREIQQHLDELGEELSKKELANALGALLAEGAVEAKGERYRLKPKPRGREAFERLFEDR